MCRNVINLNRYCFSGTKSYNDGSMLPVNGVPIKIIPRNDSFLPNVSTCYYRVLFYTAILLFRYIIRLALCFCRQTNSPEALLMRLFTSTLSSHRSSIYDPHCDFLIRKKTLLANYQKIYVGLKHDGDSMLYQYLPA